MNKLEELIQQYCHNGVVYKKIGTICNISRGVVMSKDFIRDNEGEYPVYSSQTENNGELGRISTYRYDGEYLTWTTDGANAGSVFYRCGRFSITNVCGLLEVKNRQEMLVKFLYYSLSIAAPKYVNKGMGNAKLMSNVMATVEVPVPPMEVQREIVHILDSFTFYTSELSAELSARREQYNYYRDKLLSGGNIVRKKLKEICDIFLGLTYTPTYVESGVVFLSSKNIANDFLDLSDTKFISLEEYKTSTSNAKPQKGDILFTRVGSNLGHPVIVDTDEDLCIFVSLGYIRVKNNNVSNRFLKHWMTSNLFMDQVKAKTKVAPKANLNTTWLREFYIELPSIEDQTRIADNLDLLENMVLNINDGLPAEIEARKKQYEYYRDKLLDFNRIN